MTQGLDKAFKDLMEDVCTDVRNRIENFEKRFVLELSPSGSEPSDINKTLKENNVFKNEVKDFDSLSTVQSTPTITKNVSRENLKDKVFMARASLLTEMLEINHIKTIYNIFVAILIVFSLNTVVFDLIEGEKLVWNFDLITYSLGQFPHVIVVWCCMKLTTIIILFPLYRLYALLIVSNLQNILVSKLQKSALLNGNNIKDEPLRMRINLKTQHRHSHKKQDDGDTTNTRGNDKSIKPGTHLLYERSISILFAFLYVLYQILFLSIPIYYIVKVYDLPPASSFLITLEQLRLMMKTHSFVRENVSKIKKVERALDEGKDIESKDILKIVPNFSHFLYFLFAPTLIYRDCYPRTSIIHWDYVVSNLLQVLTCLFYTYYIFVRFCIPVFKHFNQDHLTPKTLILSVFGCMLPGTMVLLIAFFGVLHSWLNAFAEMLRFADRQFYKDWWNSNSFTNYYRTWNVVVHDWLYLYVYKDILLCFGGGMSRALAMLIVFQISALAHEMVIAVAFRFFYPVLLIMFGIIGFAAMFITNKGVTRGWNILLWVMMFAGNGLLMTLYSMEWYARKNCPSRHMDSKTADFFIPRSWYCQHDVNN